MAMASARCQAIAKCDKTAPARFVLIRHQREHGRERAEYHHADGDHDDEKQQAARCRDGTEAVAQVGDDMLLRGCLVNDGGDLRKRKPSNGEECSDEVEEHDRGKPHGGVEEDAEGGRAYAGNGGEQLVERVDATLRSTARKQGDAMREMVFSDIINQIALLKPAIVSSENSNKDKLAEIKGQLETMVAPACLSPHDRPQAILLGGQSGVGKTTLHHVFLEMFKKDVIVINGDEYRKLHPRFFALQSAYGDKAVDYTAQWAGRMVEAIVEALSSASYNLVIEGTLRMSQVPLATATLLRERGYDVSLAMTASQAPEEALFGSWSEEELKHYASLKAELERLQRRS